MRMARRLKHWGGAIVAGLVCSFLAMVTLARL
jgi:hypothetical protein